LDLSVPIDDVAGEWEWELRRGIPTMTSQTQTEGPAAAAADYVH